jgi:hypothetical protein
MKYEKEKKLFYWSILEEKIHAFDHDTNTKGCPEFRPKEFLAQLFGPLKNTSIPVKNNSQKER